MQKRRRRRGSRLGQSWAGSASTRSSSRPSPWDTFERGESPMGHALGEMGRAASVPMCVEAWRDK